MALISIVVPIYKVEPYLRRCVDSILKQTFTDFEVILVDDGSPDSCGEICDEYAMNDERIHVIHRENGGLSAARNSGIEWAFANSHSEWITFIDSDDWIQDKYLEALYNAAKDCNTNISICGYEKTEGITPQVSIECLQASVWNTKEYYIQNHINATVAWGKLYLKECFRDIRYPEGKIHEDEFTTHKCLFMFDKVAVVEEPLYAYYTNAEGIMLSAWNPKRLHALDAYAERVDWFKQRGMMDLYLWTLEKYVWYIFAVRKKIIAEEDITTSKKYGPRLKKRLAKVLLRYHNDLSISKCTGAYELAFPNFMKCYWYYKALIKKIR